MHRPENSDDSRGITCLFGTQGVLSNVEERKFTEREGKGLGAGVGFGDEVSVGGLGGLSLPPLTLPPLTLNPSLVGLLSLGGVGIIVGLGLSMSEEDCRLLGLGLGLNEGMEAWSEESAEEDSC